MTIFKGIVHPKWIFWHHLDYVSNITPRNKRYKSIIWGSDYIFVYLPHKREFHTDLEQHQVSKLWWNEKSTIFPVLYYFLQFKIYAKELTQRQPIHLRCSNQISLLYNYLCCTVMRVYGDVCWHFFYFSSEKKLIIRRGLLENSHVNQTAKIC